MFIRPDIYNAQNIKRKYVISPEICPALARDGWEVALIVTRVASLVDHQTQGVIGYPIKRKVSRCLKRFTVLRWLSSWSCPTLNCVRPVANHGWPLFRVGEFQTRRTLFGLPLVINALLKIKGFTFKTDMHSFLEENIHLEKFWAVVLVSFKSSILGARFSLN